MSTLEQCLKLQLPTVWISTQDTYRVINKIVNTSRQDVYKIDPFQGLSKWVDDMWKIILVPSPMNPEELVPIGDIQQAVMYVYSNKGSLIVTNAELVAEKLVEPVSVFQEQYRTSFFKDDVRELKSSIYFLSVSDEIPNTYGRNITLIYDDLPAKKEIDLIFDGIKSVSPTSLGDTNNAKQLSGNSLGLSESEIITTSLSLITENGYVSSKLMNDARVKYLKARNIELVDTPITFEDLGGMDIAKEIIAHSAKLFSNPEKDVAPINKILLIGVPGCGKSALCKATANHLGLRLARTGVSHQMSKWIGESERNMRQTLASIFAMSPICLWVDELGRDLSGSGTSNDGGTTDRVHGEFLTGLQEMPDNVYLMAAANRVDGLPPEMLRQGRFDEILFVGFPSQNERAKIFEIYLKEDANKFDINQLAIMSEGFTGAEIESLVKKTRFSVSSGYGAWDTNTILNLMGETKNLIIIRHTHEILHMYNRARQDWQWASSEQRFESERVLSGDFGPMKAMQLKKNEKPKVSMHQKATGF